MPLYQSAVWSDYDGDEIYGDYTMDTQGLVTETASFEPGLAQVDLLGGGPHSFVMGREDVSEMSGFVVRSGFQL